TIAHRPTSSESQGLICAVARHDRMTPPLAAVSCRALVAVTTTRLRHAPTHLAPPRPHPQLPTPLHAHPPTRRRDPPTTPSEMGRLRDAPRDPVPPHPRCSHLPIPHRRRRARRLNFLVLLCIWNAMKVTFMGPASVVLLIRRQGNRTS